MLPVFVLFCFFQNIDSLYMTENKGCLPKLQLPLQRMHCCLPYANNWDMLLCCKKKKKVSDLERTGRLYMTLLSAAQLMHRWLWVRIARKACWLAHCNETKCSRLTKFDAIWTGAYKIFFWQTKYCGRMLLDCCICVPREPWNVTAIFHESRVRSKLHFCMSTLSSQLSINADKTPLLSALCKSPHVLPGCTDRGGISMCFYLFADYIAGFKCAESHPCAILA